MKREIQSGVLPLKIKIRLIIMFLLISTIALIPNLKLSAFSGEGNYLIELFMTEEDRIKSGYFKLSENEKDNLNLWFIRTIIKILSMKDKYNNTGKSVQIDENCNGKILILADGSVWSVNIFDRLESFWWRSFDRVIVVESSNPMYPYKIINLTQDEEISAKYLGSQ